MTLINVSSRLKLRYMLIRSLSASTRTFMEVCSEVLHSSHRDEEYYDYREQRDMQCSVLPKNEKYKDTYIYIYIKSEMFL